MGRVAAIDRFLAFVDKSGPGGCWLWTGSTNLHGYGVFTEGRGRRYGAHRWSYQHFVGPIPEGLDLDHLCRVRHCVNPAHVEPVTRKVNLNRGIRTEHQAMKTHCPQGHEYSPENTGHTGTWRYCRTCKRLKRAAARAAASARKRL